ncbi:hypothetical protein KY290_006165 [Solanum tuberosum]|uniref:Uncharacterized protein n=2 Tax=Solanum tuberosum TaxID=4113 RepID=A0ABQ7WG68_SOLTU|nr:hypothetical protein KY284_006277 [Solanum tuberosum]KAH0779738.1 hypothetical protein KY290_006165 [Solanum tuberosum]
MAQISIVKSFLVALIVVVFSATTSAAQEIGLAPAPTPDAGAGFSLAQSGALVASSLLVSAVALLRN